MKIITDNQTNHGDNQNHIIKLEEKGLIFKINIHNQSYDFQSYAKLELLNKNGEWTILENRNPQKDYNIKHTYNKITDPKHFATIIKDFKKLIEEQYAPILSQGFYNTNNNDVIKEEKNKKQVETIKPKKQKITHG